MRAFGAFLDDQRGATAVEYGLIATLVGTVSIGALAMLGQVMSGRYGTLSTALINAGNG